MKKICIESSMGLTRFLNAQNQTYLKALSELKAGRKGSHWMWYIFPQLKGLGHRAQYYGINGIDEATAYLDHPVLGKHLIEIATIILTIEGKTAIEIFGSPDNMKLRSSMTLFSRVPNAHPVFLHVLDKFFNGLPDDKTLDLLKNIPCSERLIDL
ncbi:MULTISPECIES: DUF1810 domain-containing protein [Sphingobacterium]|jgi:uncharacterized protein (DUF1810 family)|uniref:DUF1810 domain-containing protein n=1 Tax=Sphingobacterium TaxID=28453 RepID=UPI0028ABCB46|nr:DUF1810 domain-containing protein [Sphingobacterium multivorum]